ncbi:MAG: hypothetical protein JWP08_1911 [Bryobacterales bacterium]|nr:hypothetical protein [Bryobacterales bacterium]
MCESWHRRHAVQIAAQLPENPEDALIVLDLAKSLVEGFLKDQPRPLERDADIVAFPASANSR